jgi:pantothenate kinase type III
MSGLVLAIDIGNSSTDLGLVDPDALRCVSRRTVDSAAGARAAASAAAELLAECDTIPPAILATVRGGADELCALLRATPGVTHMRQVRMHDRLPFTLCYDTPDRFGADRIANCCYARRRYPDRATLVIDCGTTVNAEYCTADGRCPGGAIFPGPRAQLDTLQRATVSLPAADMTGAGAFPGGSTHEGMLAGVRAACAGGVMSLIAQARARAGDSPVVTLATGGAWNFIAPLVDCRIEHVPDLTLCGIGCWARVTAE